MSGRAWPVIRLRGVRHNNLKNFDLDLPLNRLIVVTGLSGSGKSSLAFDTLFAEGQRRYIETFSPYARQFFERMDRPKVDAIEGIPPAIAVEQRNTVRTTRSTVGTMTEICDYLKVVWPHLAQLHCRQCGRVVRRDPPQRIWAALSAEARAATASGAAPPEALVTFDLPLSARLSLAESLALVAKQGYQRLLIGSEICRAEAVLPRLQAQGAQFLTIVQDRLKLGAANRARLVEACEQAYHFGQGRLSVWRVWPGASSPGSLRLERHCFSNRLHCAQCNLEYREPTPALFSFNHPLGACPACRGFGRIITIDLGQAIPDRARTLAQGVVRPWLSGVSAECQEDLLEFCRRRGVPTDVPFARLAPKWQDWVIQGDPDYGKDAAHRWPLAWYGVQGYFRWLESKAYKMHVRVLLARYRSYQACPACQGQRLQPEALFYRLESPVRSSIGGQKLASLTLADFYHLPLQEAWPMTQALAARYAAQPHDPVGLALQEVCSRLGYLVEIGLGYLALDRPTRTLSGGETERVNLATCLGSRLVSTLFVLDEPSVGLHPRDTERLVRILKRLRDAGNTVVVVEHEASVIQAADHIVDLGPGHGETGGEVVFQGGYARLLDCPGSLTGLYLSGQRRIELPVRRPVCSAEPGPREPADGDGAFLTLSQATRYNLRDLTVRIPLARFVCVAGVSGSGKTTLVREILLPALESKLRRQQPPPPAEKQSSEAGEEEKEDDARLRGQPAQLTGWERLGRVVLVDQGPIGKTPRSNPALYVGAFDHLRKLFAESEDARRRGLTPGAFSFNSAEGRCERCHGAGFEKIEMQFLSDVFIRCPDCDGRRYRPHVLEARLRPQLQRQPGQTALAAPDSGLNIAGLLEATVDEAVAFLAGFRGSPAGEAALASLELLRAVGLGYLRLGQPINTLSGGEAQRLKLASHLKEMKWTPGHRAEGRQPRRLPLSKPTLFLFDEPTTGLHFDDVRVLLQVFQRLVEAGHSVLVIEHNLDVIKAADWVIDLGPEAGEQGGQLVAEGTPEMIAACPKSHTGAALQKIGVPAVRGNCGA